MIFIYNIFIFFYSLGIKLAALAGNDKARKWMTGRKLIFDRIGATLKPGEKRTWFHCASLGEFEQGRPLIEDLRLKIEDCKIVLTFFSPSGYEVRKNYAGADYIFYLPVDTRLNAKRFIDLIQPEKAFFVKYEYWHHYFKELKQRNIPLYILSAIFRNDQPFFKWYGSFFRNILKCVTYFFVQDEDSKDLLQSIGFTNAVVSGDTRFDRVASIAASVKSNPILEQFKNGKTLFIAGSTWHPDEDILIRLIESNPGKIEKFIIAPHQISAARIESLYNKLNTKSQTGKPAWPVGRVLLYSKATGNIADATVLIIDNIGMLSSLYSYGDIGYIGGGFGIAVHNTLEAAVFGMPLFFGTNYKKFKEACDLVELGAAFPITGFDDLRSKLEEITGDEMKWKSISDISRNYVKSKTGATEIILKAVNTV